VVFNTGPYIVLPDKSILNTANVQSETGFPSSQQLKSYVVPNFRLKLAARAVLSADAGLLVITANMQSYTGFPSSHQLKSYVASKSRLKLAARAVLSADAGLSCRQTYQQTTDQKHLRSTPCCACPSRQRSQIQIRPVFSQVLLRYRLHTGGRRRIAQYQFTV